MNVLRDFGCGAVVGIANIIPGVSGGTMAVILNVYDRLLETLGLKNLRKNLPFILFFGMGALSGILGFSHAIEFLLSHYPMATNFTFMGLILGGFPLIWKNARQTVSRIHPVSVVVLVAAFALMMWMNSTGVSDNGVMEDLTLSAALWLGGISAISAFAMILPGVSGSFVMLLLGAYPTVLNAIAHLDILTLIPVAIGCALGLLLGSRLVSFLLERCPQQAYFGILGLIAGSLFALYPGFALNMEGMVSIVLLLGASGLTYWFSSVSKG